MNFDSDFDYDCYDSGGGSDFGDGHYGGDVDGYYHDAYDLGDFDADVDISGDHDFEIYAGDDLYGGEDLEAEFGGNERDLAAEFRIDGRDDSDGDVDIAAELGLADGDNDVDGDGLSEAGYGTNVRDISDGDVDIAAELGIGDGNYDVDGDVLSAPEYGNGRDDSNGDVDIVVELGLGGDDYFNDIRDLSAGFVANGGYHDVDGDGLSAVEFGPNGGHDFDDDQDFEAEFGIHGGNDDIVGDGGRHLLEAEFGIDGDDFYGDGDLEAVSAFEVDDSGDVLVPVVEVDDYDDDNDNGGNESVPVVDVDDDDSDYYHYYSNSSGAEHHRVEDLDDVASLVHSSRRSLWPGTAFRLQRVQLDDDEDLVVNRDNNTSAREITVQSSPLMSSSSNSGVGRLIQSNSNPNVRRNEEEKEGEMMLSSEDAKKDTNANGSENDGVSCPICLEPWTSDGDHIICCLPCGHVYGMSCIKSWLQQPNSGKCPLCNKVCSIEGIRKIYGLTIVTAEKDLKEKIQLLEARCASLELNNGDWQRKEAEWRQSEAVLLQQLKPNSNN